MSVDRREIYEFGDYRLDVGERMIERLDGLPSTTLPDKTFETLVMLIRRRGHLVTKDELLRHVWPDTIVEENNLEKRIHSLRQFLGKGEEGEAFIETVRGHGYRFVGRVGVVEVSGSWLPETYRSLNNGSHESKVKPNGDGNGHNGHVATMTEIADRDEVKAINGSVSRKTRVAAGIVGLLLVAVTIGYFAFFRATTAASPRTIVILPAVPIQAAEHNDLFEIGIAESLINRLASADGWTIRPLSSVRDYVGSKVDPFEAGREQKADYVLAANYQIAGGKIKVTSQLFDVTTGKIEGTFESLQDVANVFAAQDAIAAEFTKSMMTRLGVSASQPARARGTDNEEAYRAYIQGMYLLDKTLPEGAIEYLDRAVTLDPGYAKAWAGKGSAHVNAAMRDRELHYPKAVDATNRSLAIDPNLSDGYSALCKLKHLYDWDYAGAEQACLRAIELDATSAIARQAYSVLLVSQRRGDEAVAQLKVAMELEPSSHRTQDFYADFLFLSRRYDEAVAQFKTVVAMKPDKISTYQWFVRTLEAQGNEAEAYEWFMKSLVAGKQSEEMIQKFRTAYETSGYRGVLLERIATVDKEIGFRKAGAYARLGDKDKAFEVLEQMYQKRVWSIAVLVPVDPQLDPIRDDPRYDDLIRRIEGK